MTKIEVKCELCGEKHYDHQYKLSRWSLNHLKEKHPEIYNELATLRNKDRDIVDSTGLWVQSHHFGMRYELVEIKGSELNE